MLAGEIPEERKTLLSYSIRTDARLMGMHQLTGRWNVIWKERSTSEIQAKNLFTFHYSFATIVLQ